MLSRRNINKRSAESLILFLVSPFFSVPFLIFNAFKRNIFSIRLLLLILSLICFLFIPNFDHDKTRYIERYEYFKYISIDSFLFYLKVNSSDYVFIGLIFIFAKIGIPLEYLLGLLAFITLTLLFNSLKKCINFKTIDSRSFNIFIALFFLSISLPALFSGVRFLLGASFFLNAFYYLIIERKKTLGIVFYFISFQIHFSLIFFLPALLVLYFDSRGKINYVLIFILSCLFSVVSATQLMTLISALDIGGNIADKINVYLLGEDFLNNAAEQNFANYIVYLIGIAWYIPSVVYIFLRRGELNNDHFLLKFSNYVLLFFAFSNIFYNIPTVFSRYISLSKYIMIMFLILDIYSFRRVKYKIWLYSIITLFALNILVSLNAFRYNLAKSLYKIDTISIFTILEERVTTDELLNN